MRAISVALCALGGFLMLASCTFVVDTNELQAGDAGLQCGPEEKICPDRLAPEYGVCVSKTSVSYGCGSEKCVPCAFANASPRCDGASCAMGPCQGRYEDCNEKTVDGCEADLDRDERNCGTCDHECSADNGVTACSEGQCQIVYCRPPFADCDSRYITGCETDTRSSSEHCGNCGAPCAGACVDGVCNP